MDDKIYWNIDQITRAFGVGRGTINNLIDEGIVIKDKKNCYDSVESVLNFRINRLENETIKSAKDERARLDKLRADKIEMELTIARGELMNPDDAMREWSKTVQAVRARLLSIPSKGAPLLVGTKSEAEAQNILQRLIYEALKELANPDLIDIALNIQNEKRKKNNNRKK